MKDTCLVELQDGDIGIFYHPFDKSIIEKFGRESQLIAYFHILLMTFPKPLYQIMKK